MWKRIHYFCMELNKYRDLGCLYCSRCDEYITCTLIHADKIENQIKKAIIQNCKKLLTAKQKQKAEDSSFPK